MSAFTNYLEQQLIGCTLLGSTFTSPTTIYVGLATAFSSDGSTITEVNTGSYARQPIPFTPVSGSVASNNGDVTFPQATADWGTITHTILYDAVSGGNPLYWAEETIPRVVEEDDILVKPDGSIIVTLD